MECPIKESVHKWRDMKDGIVIQGASVPIRCMPYEQKIVCKGLISKECLCRDGVFLEMCRFCC
jgi:hypothetical protein